MSSDLETLKSAIRLVTDIRSKTAKLLQTSADGVEVKHGRDDVRDKRFLQDLKHQIDFVQNDINELDNTLTNQSPSVPPLPLGPSLYMCLDTAPDSSSIYQNMVTGYRWLEKTRDFAGVATSYLAQNNLNRSTGLGKLTRSRKRATNTVITASPQMVDQFMHNINQLYPDMHFKISRPNGSKLNAYVELHLERVLKAILIFKGLMVEWVNVKAYNEETLKPDGQLDIWTKSKYQVFQKITENASAAMLHFHSPQYPEVAVKSFMTYLHSYVTVFTDRCKSCNNYLKNNMPPTWREFKSLEPYHDDCRP